MLKKLFVCLLIVLCFCAFPIGSAALEDNGFEYADIGNGVKITKYKGNEEEVIIPGLLGQKPVLHIAANAFDNCSFVKSIVVPASVKKIGRGAFSGCTALENLTVGFLGYEGVTDAFLGYFFGANRYSDNYNMIPKSLKTVTLTEGMTNIPNCAFSDCRYIQNISLPSTVKIIGWQSFQACFNLKEIILPEALTSIEYGAFSNCSEIKSIDIPKNVGNIDKTAFTGCRNLSSVNVSLENTAYLSENGILYDKDKSNLIYYPAYKADADYVLPESVTRIEIQYLCENIKLKNIHVQDNSVYCSEDGILYDKSKTVLYRYPAEKNQNKYSIPDGVEVIDKLAFYGCCNLKEIVLPESVLKISEVAFQGCTNLEKINLPDSLEDIRTGAFLACTSLKSIKIPNKITNISNILFASCISLEKVEISENIHKIVAQAFYNCTSLKEINLPETVTSIGNGAFNNCIKLEKITILSEKTLYGENVFANTGKKLKMVVVKGSDSEKYAKANNISYEYIEDETTDITGKATLKITKENNLDRIEAVIEIEPKDANYTYQWYGDGAEIPNAAGGSYQLKESDYGKTFMLKITASAPYKGTVESLPLKTDKKLSSIKITANPHKLIYDIGEELLLDGMTVTLKYSDGTEEKIKNGFETEGFDSKTEGRKVVKISYGGYSDSLKIDVGCSHKLSIWQNTRKATKSQKGIRSYICTACKTVLEKRTTSLLGSDMRKVILYDKKDIRKIFSALSPGRDTRILSDKAANKIWKIKLQINGK